MWVVKLGGAMMHAPDLAAWLEACATAPEPCTVVIGGGALADEIRALQASWHFDDALADECALTAMALNARIAARLAPALEVFSALEAAPASGCGLWLPQPPCRGLDLPQTWAVTADSIAYRVAVLLGAAGVLLVKSAPAAACRYAGVEAAADAGLVDAYLPTLVRRHGLPVRVSDRAGHAAFAGGGRSGWPLG
ncbi:MAG: hypothetical protein WD928_08630 [Gammaproteobacteria bacterium]